jgi:AGZA family xanthine/uracil permease-like MFS transporter
MSAVRATNSPETYPAEPPGTTPGTTKQIPTGNSFGARFDRYFSITERGSTGRRELRGGIATFFTMAYIVVLNPLILSSSADSTGAKLSGPAIATVTALVAAVMTVLMGVYGRYPFALAAGLGINGVVAFQLAPQMTWAGAMGIVVLEGLAITLLVLTGLRELILDAIPLALKQSISVGIGLFIAFIGFVDSGFVRRSESGTPVGLGIGNRLMGWPTIVFALGLLLGVVLVARRVPGAILLTLIGGTAFAIVLQLFVDVPAAAGAANSTGWALNVPAVPDKIIGSPDFSLLGNFSLRDAFSIGVISALLAVFTLMLADFFDTMGTVVGVGAEGGLLDSDGRLPGVNRVLLVDSLAAVAGGAASSSSNTTYIESASGVGEGARTGVASLVTGALFLLAIPFTPLVTVVPYEAASPVLVIVGFLLMTQVRDIPWNDYDLAIPAFLTIVLMPFTYSITNGIGAGFIAFVAIKAAKGKWREPGILLWVVSLLFVIYFAIDPVEQALGVK